MKMDLQALYDLKERLEHAAIAGTGLLQEDFRLKRAAEALAPLAAASPVFAKISSATQSLLTAPAAERGQQLLDVLSLVDAVVYTQGATDVPGDLTPLEPGSGTYVQASYGQLRPLLTALTTTGSGRIEVIQSAQENHPEFFADFRVLPTLVADLGDSYAEIAELNAKILKQAGPSALPLLKQGFDPAGKKEMARRVEVLSAIEGAGATPWLLEVLPAAKKDVRVEVLTALGNDPGNAALLLDLAKKERSGGHREAVLRALAKQDGAAVQAFWAEELKENSGSVRFLQDTDADWAGSLLASGLREQLEEMLANGDRVSEEAQTELSSWCQAVGKKTPPAMLDFWRWADGHMETFDRLTNKKGNPIFVGVRLTDTLKDCLHLTGPGPLRDFCLTLFDRRPSMTRYLPISFHAALLARPAAEVYEKFAPYILTKKPFLDAERKKSLNTVLLRALGDVWWLPQQNRYILHGGQSLAEPLDRRWIQRLTQAVYTDLLKARYALPFPYQWENIGAFDLTLMRLSDTSAEENRKLLVPYLRKRLGETGQVFLYSRWLLEVGGSPRGLLDSTAEPNFKIIHFYTLWELMHEASKVLPTGEVVGLCQELLSVKWIRPGDREHKIVQTALTRTIEQLQAGTPFPDWEVWQDACK